MPEHVVEHDVVVGTPPEFWLNLQRTIDLWDATRGLEPDINRIVPLEVA